MYQSANFAWKIIAMQEFSKKALAANDAVLWLDSGLEVASPFLAG